MASEQEDVTEMIVRWNPETQQYAIFPEPDSRESSFFADVLAEIIDAQMRYKDFSRVPNSDWPTLLAERELAQAREENERLIGEGFQAEFDRLRMERAELKIALERAELSIRSLATGETWQEHERVEDELAQAQALLEHASRLLVGAVQPQADVSPESRAAFVQYCRDWQQRYRTFLSKEESLGK